MGKKSKKKEMIERRENIYTIPNLLTISRLFIFFYLRMWISQGKYSRALIGLGIAGITDLLDGWIARTWKSQASYLGSLIDPMCDKILIGGLYLTLSSINLVPVSLAYVVVTHNIIQLLRGGSVRYFSIPPPRTLQKFFDPSLATAQLFPTYMGKVNCVLQICFMTITLWAANNHITSHPLLVCSWYLIGFTTVCAQLSYVLQTNRFKIITPSMKID